MLVRSLTTAVMILVMCACASTSDTPAVVGQSAQESQPGDGPPVVNGLWEERISIACPGTHCYGPLAAAAADLRAQPNAGAPIVGRLVAGEWVQGVEWIYRMRPIRGEVRAAFDAYYDGRMRTIQPGAIIYIVDARQDDGSDYQVWFQGFTFTLAADDERIEWALPSAAQRAADEAVGAGEWVRVRRDSGQEGFVNRWAVECLAEWTEYCEHARPASPTPQN
jgi:hypothetical protein